MIAPLKLQIEITTNGDIEPRFENLYIMRFMVRSPSSSLLTQVNLQEDSSPKCGNVHVKSCSNGKIGDAIPHRGHTAEKVTSKSTRLPKVRYLHRCKRGLKRPVRRRAERFCFKQKQAGRKHYRIHLEHSCYSSLLQDDREHSAEETEEDENEETDTSIHHFILLQDDAQSVEEPEDKENLESNSDFSDYRHNQTE